MRVVSLIASSTEIVCALGLGDRLVGRSHECDFPETVRRLPALTETKIDIQASSRAIDEQVKELAGSALSVYRIDAERLKALKPDVIITQIQCDVCAVSLKDVEAALGADLGASAKVVSLEPNCLNDVWNDIRKVADALEAAGEGEALIHRLKSRMSAVAEAAKPLPKPSVACLEWLDPLMSAGNWMPELVEMAGGQNLFGEAGRHSPPMPQGALAQADPDVIVAMPCGFDLKRTKLETFALSTLPEWSSLKAVKGGRFFAADGNQFFNRPGPRLAESLEILAELLHPKEFSFGHRGKGWDRHA